MKSGREQRLWALASTYSLEILIGACALCALVFELYAVCYIPQYTIADWLINYSQGFVRRGLVGQVVLLAARPLHMPPPIMVCLVQLIVYGIFLRGVYILAKPLRRDILWYALMFSPATLTFPITNVAMGIRKEVLMHMFLVCTIFLIRRKMPAVALSLYITAFLGTLVLSHETLACCFPYFFAAVAIGAGNLVSPLKIMAAPLAMAAVLENIARKHIGTLSVSMGICRSVGGRWVGANDSHNLCAGAIGHISWTIEMYRKEELENLHYWPLYAMGAVLALAPLVTALVVMYRRDRLRFEVKVIATIATLCALLSVPLFYLAIDWGRWIYMQTICLLLLILMAAQHAKGFLRESKAPPLGEGKRWRIPLLAALVLCYSVWTLPVVGLSPQRYGYFDIPRALYANYESGKHQLRWDQIDRGF